MVGHNRTATTELVYRHFAAERLEPAAHIAGRQLSQRLEADVLQQRLSASR